MRGYIYTLDVAVALFIIIIGILAFIGLYSFDPDTEGTQRFTTETMSTLESIELQQLCSDGDPSTGSGCDCSYTIIEDLCSDREISRMDQSILSAMGELYSKGEREAIEDIVEEVLIGGGLMPAQYGFKILLEDSGEMHQLYPLVEVSP